MKKIVFVIESLNLGGAEKSLVTLLQNLDYKKYNVDVIIFNKGGVFESNIPKEVTIIYNSMTSLTLFDRLLFQLKKRLNFRSMHFAQLLWEIISNKFEKVSLKYDVAIAYNQGFATYFTAKYITANIKFAWLNTDYQKAGYAIAFDYPFYNNFNAVVAVSEQVKTGFSAEVRKINKELRIEVIKDISDPSIINKQSLKIKEVDFQFEKTNIVTVGRLANAKGIILALETCKNLIDKGFPIHWYIIGEGPDRKNIESVIAKKKLEKHVTIVGQISNPYPYMKDCDIYVQTSLFEGLGLTVIEASFLCKPIVCTNFPTAYTILKDNETGLIAEMNAQSIASKIELLIKNENLRNRLVSNLASQENNDQAATLQQFDHLMKEHFNA